jgi:hypothetical protein
MQHAEHRQIMLEYAKHPVSARRTGSDGAQNFVAYFKHAGRFDSYSKHSEKVRR